MLDLFKRKEKEGQHPKMVCNICKMEFADKGRLAKHKKVAHPKGR